MHFLRKFTTHYFLKLVVTPFHQHIGAELR